MSAAELLEAVRPEAWANADYLLGRYLTASAARPADVCTSRAPSGLPPAASTAVGGSILHLDAYRARRGLPTTADTGLPALFAAAWSARRVYSVQRAAWLVGHGTVNELEDALLLLRHAKIRGKVFRELVGLVRWVKSGRLEAWIADDSRERVAELLNKRLKRMGAG